MWAGIWIIPGLVLGIFLSLMLLPADAPLSDSERVLATQGSTPRPSPSPVLAWDEAAPATRSTQAEPLIAPMPIEGPGTEVPPPAPAPTSGTLPAPAEGTPAPAASASPRAKAARSARSSPRYRGSLIIESDPEGAQVSLNGRVVGSTPILLEDLPAGSCVVRVEADGYEPWSTAARVVAHRENRVSATLQRESHNQP